MAKKRVYWDSCAWIGLINKEADKYAACRYEMEEAEKGEVEIWTSALAIAEVFKKKCGEAKGDPAGGIAPTDDAEFEDYVLRPHVIIVEVNRDVASYARTLLRKHSPPLKKPADAIHLATAAMEDVSDFRTYDTDDLIRLSGLVQCRDGTMMTISRPLDPPPPPPAASGPLFDAT